MMFTALAIVLLHNVIAHAHHEPEHQHLGHQHFDDVSHDDHERKSEKEQDSTATVHQFSLFNHVEQVIILLPGLDQGHMRVKGFIPFVDQLNISEVYPNFQTLERQNSPPHHLCLINYHHHLPTGLRAPPFFIV
ncbi:MAG: hypothetical protein ACI8ZN_000575 [Bacteroidia bacterium]|jgi:hypothetical protein